MPQKHSLFHFGRVRASLFAALFLFLSAEAVHSVEIPDPALEAAIRNELNKPTGEITQADMESLTTLNARSSNITDLTGLDAAVNLTFLDLSYDAFRGSINGTIDLSPLAALKVLSELRLGGNKVENISPLNGLMSLTTLDLNFNRIRDLGPLIGLTGLTDLNLWFNPIEDHSPLSVLTALTKLNLRHTNIGDISFLSGLTSLTKLDLASNWVRDLEPL